MLSRRGLLFGAAAVAAPAIIRPGILMPVKRILMPPVENLTEDMLVRLIETFYCSSPEFVTVPASMLKHATATDMIRGVVAQREGVFLPGDLVAMR